MRHLLTSLALLATFAAAGQTANPFPYNPDADADGWISVNDLLSLLSSGQRQVQLKLSKIFSINWYSSCS